MPSSEPRFFPKRSSFSIFLTFFFFFYEALPFSSPSFSPPLGGGRGKMAELRKEKKLASLVGQFLVLVLLSCHRVGCFNSLTSASFKMGASRMQGETLLYFCFLHSSFVCFIPYFLVLEFQRIHFSECLSPCLG